MFPALVQLVFGRRQRRGDDSAGGARGSEQCGGGPT